MVSAKLFQDAFKRLRDENQETLLRRVKKARQNADAKAKLEAAGFCPTADGQLQYVNLKIDRTEAAKVRKALGCPLKVDSRSVWNEEERKVKVNLTPVNYDGVSLYFFVIVPKPGRGRPKKGEVRMPCKFVKVRQKAYTYTTLQCER